MSSTIGRLISNLTEYIEVKTEQLKLKIISRFARVLSNIIAFAMLAMLGLFFFFFVSFAAAEMLNQVLESTHLGYWCIAGGYLLIIILIFVLLKSKALQRWIENIIVNMAEKDDDQD